MYDVKINIACFEPNLATGSRPLIGNRQMAKVASSNAPTAVAGKPSSTLYKIPLAISILAAISAAIYVELIFR